MARKTKSLQDLKADLTRCRCQEQKIILALLRHPDSQYAVSPCCGVKFLEKDLRPVGFYGIEGQRFDLQTNGLWNFRDDEIKSQPASALERRRTHAINVLKGPPREKDAQVEGYIRDSLHFQVPPGPVRSPSEKYKKALRYCHCYVKSEELRKHKVRPLGDVDTLLAWLDKTRPGWERAGELKIIRPEDERDFQFD